MWSIKPSGPWILKAKNYWPGRFRKLWKRANSKIYSWRTIHQKTCCKYRKWRALINECWSHIAWCIFDCVISFSNVRRYWAQSPRLLSKMHWKAKADFASNFRVVSERTLPGSYARSEALRLRKWSPDDRREKSKPNKTMEKVEWDSSRVTGAGAFHLLEWWWNKN